MPRPAWIWPGAWTRTSGCTGGRPARSRGSGPVPDRGHWLAGRVAVVTGASRGIGAATAEAIADAGARVIIGAREHEALADVAGSITRAGGQDTPVLTDGSHASAVSDPRWSARE